MLSKLVFRQGYFSSQFKQETFEHVKFKERKRLLKSWDGFLYKALKMLM